MKKCVGSPVTDAKTAQAPLMRYEGKHVILERIQSKHAESLWHNVKDDLSAWDYMLSGPFTSMQDFQEYIDKMSYVQDPFLYAILPIDDLHQVVGHIALMNFNIPNRVVEIGAVLFSSKIQRKTAATEVFYLLMKASFEQINSRRLEWKTNTFHNASRRAALRLGFVFEGIFRNHMIVKGRNRDTAWYSIIESEWPAIKKTLEVWLDPSNFDKDGKQHRSLQEIANDE